MSAASTGSAAAASATSAAADSATSGHPHAQRNARKRLRPDDPSRKDKRSRKGDTEDETGDEMSPGEEEEIEGGGPGDAESDDDGGGGCGGGGGDAWPSSGEGEDDAGYTYEQLIAMIQTRKFWPEIVLISKKAHKERLATDDPPGNHSPTHTHTPPP